ncbi:tectonic-3 isoform X2 [Numida meleagris]|uniref:tectonic-3 isoform X2 n=1 Tax=Numida meleagris TaxID=8996 RepID=UPI000B3DD2AF|nr:tectonic-3 isoform X2 [Numida meleagris]
MSGARELLLALLLARVVGGGPGTALGATAELTAGGPHKAVRRNEAAAPYRASAVRVVRAGAQISAGDPLPFLHRRAPRAAPSPLPAARGLPARGRPPGVCSLCRPGAGSSSRLASSRSVNQVCVEKSLIFRSNTPYRTNTIAVSGGPDLFCVQLDDPTSNYFQQPKRIKESDFPKLLRKYGGHSFLALSQVQPSFSAFYRVGDPILIYFDSLSILSVLRQPVKMGVSGLCVDGNPAGFLESKSTSCTRTFTNLSRSCVTDPALDAASYYRDFAVLKVPIIDTIAESMKVKISPVGPPGAPYMKDNMCNNAVSEVIYEIEFNGTHGIQSVSVRFKVTSISGNSGFSLQQHFTLHFWTRTLSHQLPRSGNPGYITGAPLLIANTSAVQHMSILQSESDGSCSQFLRHTVRFGSNMRTGCKLRLTQMEESNCSYVQLKLYKAFQGMNQAEDLAIIGSAHSTQVEERMTILIQNCSVQTKNCSSCCMVPVTLDIQILWAKMGLLSNPQAQILGVRYFYQCHPLKFLRTSLVPLTTVVTFTDMTEWPEPPRGLPKTHWKLPFDFFFPFKAVLNVERSYRDDLTACFVVILILSSILCF